MIWCNRHIRNVEFWSKLKWVLMSQASELGYDVGTQHNAVSARLEVRDWCGNFVVQ